MTNLAPLPHPLISFNSSEATIEAVGGKGANLVKLAKLPVESANGSNISTFKRRREQPARKVEE